MPNVVISSVISVVFIALMVNGNGEGIIGFLCILKLVFVGLLCSHAIHMMNVIVILSIVFALI